MASRKLPCASRDEMSKEVLDQKMVKDCGNLKCNKNGKLRCCKTIYYCSEECQKSSWKNHKKRCREEKVFLDEDLMLPDRRPDFDANGKQYRLANMLNQTGIGCSSLPSFHIEYASKHSADKYGFDILRDNFTNNQLCSFSKSSGQFDELFAAYGHWQQVLAKRWSFFSRELIEFILSKPVAGTIYEDHPFLQNQQKYGYMLTNFGTSKKIYQILRNTTVHSDILEKGKCYVSIGCVDLQQILLAKFTGEEGCINWHGYDASKICVARAKLILELLISNFCSAQEILQIWFSSSVSSTAQKAIEKCCKVLLLAEEDVDIRIIFKFWGKKRISTNYARNQVRQNLSSSTVDAIMRLKREKDRIDYARYLLTGEMFLEETIGEIVGNSTMFSLPEKFEDHKKREENFFHTIPLDDVEWNHDLFVSVEKFLTTKLIILKDLIKKKELLVKMHSRRFDEEQLDVLDEVKELNPDRIDWSNLPDYMRIDDFFSMARSCSASQTEHSFHLMNWTTKVFGASLFDYFLPDVDQDYFIDTNGETRNLYLELKRNFLALVERDVGGMPFIKINPKLLDIINTSERALSHRYFGVFVDFMFRNTKAESLNWKLDQYTPFSRANTVANIRFKFEK
eukprot:GFUD01007803.1.p1 GENE.GFUD01007803.1~~GFUD01007803.1.p1  ORF type:complete len:624 (+),score=105.13 GFUD01007803.1:137-2008(+)